MQEDDSIDTVTAMLLLQDERKRLGLRLVDKGDQVDELTYNVSFRGEDWTLKIVFDKDNYLWYIYYFEKESGQLRFDTYVEDVRECAARVAELRDVCGHSPLPLFGGVVTYHGPTISLHTPDPAPEAPDPDAPGKFKLFLVFACTFLAIMLPFPSPEEHSTPKFLFLFCIHVFILSISWYWMVQVVCHLTDSKGESRGTGS